MVQIRSCRPYTQATKAMSDLLAVPQRSHRIGTLSYELQALLRRAQRRHGYARYSGGNRCTL